MAEIIHAHQLEVGDVFFDPRFSQRLGELKRVDRVRTMRSVETYTVVDYRTLASKNAGQLNLHHDLHVTRVNPLDNGEAMVALAEIKPGEKATFWRRADGGFYA